ncbi:ribosome modulation factor [Gallaecimonas pentaromativorans]|uniref:ribosome modulation factor n=1 Tax=Gallaecimonas pentaromativorans TaxID=584787 RepID=UPI0009FA4E0D|nr:ribosome modulation factor [Gallaecimonas pentaromativorans]MED5525412.1 ribosome modulation factor [Pseudomonadota bacterium]
MRRQKRDRLERAQSRGYQAGIGGKPREACPYQNVDARSHWYSGWRTAVEDRVINGVDLK